MMPYIRHNAIHHASQPWPWPSTASTDMQYSMQKYAINIAPITRKLASYYTRSRLRSRYAVSHINSSVQTHKVPYTRVYKPQGRMYNVIRM